MFFIRLFSWLFLLILCSCSKDSDGIFEIKPVELADPFIWAENGIYYAYGTSSRDGIKVFTSSNLVEWYEHKQLALHKSDSYADKWFWAPDMAYNAASSKYLLYYAADNHMCVASGDSPLGPFRQNIKEPMSDLNAVDHTVYKHTDGHTYMFYSTNFESNYETWVCELDESGLNIKAETQKLCFWAEAPWECEIWPVTEGPYVIEHKGVLYMIYSGSGYKSENYAIGYAYATNPLGPWKKYEGNPILIKPNCNGTTLFGTGHGSIFTDLEGQLRLVFHAHHSDTEVEPREMYITSVHFTDHLLPKMYFGNDIIRPFCIGTK